MQVDGGGGCWERPSWHAEERLPWELKGSYLLVRMKAFVSAYLMLFNFVLVLCLTL